MKLYEKIIWSVVDVLALAGLAYLIFESVNLWVETLREMS